MPRRHLPAPHLRGFTIGDLTSLARLADAHAAGRIDEIDRLRGIWRLRALIEVTTEGDPDRATAERLLARLDTPGRAPPAPTGEKLRWMVDAAYRAGPPGALHRLAIHAGLHRNDLSRFRHGRGLAPDKIDRLGAALIAAGLTPKGD